ncbi:MFS transporter [Raoultibacter phocaeensis]|uniref:MFS transporter n=1 Tax=Raoultibacter phocaeensis TaxID=2479841 RepID=UPI00111A95C5|nr:MFS transporter [Raoultibacter phocaeensis]
MPSHTKHSSGSGKPKLWTPAFILIVGVAFCCFIVGQGLNSGTSVYINRLGGTATYAGLLAAVFSVAAAFARVLCGPIIDQKGRAIVMVIGSGLFAGGIIVPIFTNDTAAFVACRFFQGVGFSAVTTAAATAAADVLPFSRLGEGIGYYGLGQALAMSVGPALALLLVSTDPPENLFIGLAAMSIVMFVLALLCRYERNPQKLPDTSVYRMRCEAHDRGEDAEAEPEQRGLRRVFEPSALPGALPMIVLSPAFGFGIFFIGLYGTTLGIGNPGLFFSVSALSMIAVRLKSNAFMDRVAPFKVLAAAVACGIIAYLLLLAAGDVAALYYLAGIFYGACLGASMPICQSVAVKNTPAERWGAANALYLLATDVGVGIASIAWGAINDLFGFTTTICCVIACIALSLVVAWFSFPPDAKRKR